MIENQFSPSLNLYLFASGALFVMGMMGALLRRNIVVVIASLQMMFFGVILSFLTFAFYLNDSSGLINGVFLIIIALINLGFAMLLLATFFSKKESLEADDYKELHE